MPSEAYPRWNEHEDKLEDGLPSWVGTERGQLFTSGLVAYPLSQLIPMWLEKLPRELSGAKEGSSIDMPPEPDTAIVDVGGGQTIWIKPDAYRDEDGNLYAEVRERPMRTDLALLGVLATLEGGEPDPERLREYYERLWAGNKWEAGTPGRVAVAPHDIPTEDEKALLLARALLEHRDPEALSRLPKHERRERVVSMAKRIGTVVKALRAV